MGILIRKLSFCTAREQDGSSRIKRKENAMKFSVIVPCYNSQDTISELVELTREVFGQMGEEEYEFVLVNDYSHNRETLLVLL